MRIKTSYIYIYGAISHNVHYEKGCSVSPYMPYHMSEKGVPPYGKAFSGRQESPFRMAAWRVSWRCLAVLGSLSECYLFLLKTAFFCAFVGSFTRNGRMRGCILTLALPCFTYLAQPLRA